MKILIACQYATNKGDRAIAEYLLHQLQKQENVLVTLSTTRPELWTSLSNTGVRVVGMGYTDLSWRMRPGFLRKVVARINRIFYEKLVFPDLLKEKGKHTLCKMLSGDFIREVQEADLVLITGGHHITSIRSKNALFDVTYDIGLIHLFSKRYVLWSQTIGPLKFQSSRAHDFFGEVLRKAEVVYIRDDNSQKCLDEQYPGLNNVKKSYDSVFGFGELDFTPYEKRQKKVGVSIFNSLKKAYATFDAIAQILDYFAAKGYTVEFFRMEHYIREEQDIRDIISRMKVKTETKIFPFGQPSVEHLQEMASCSCYIGYKTHSVIMALTTATPLLGICYHQKTRDFMGDYGLAEYSIDDEVLTAENGIACAEAVMENAEKIYAIMQARSPAIADVVANDFRQLIFEGGNTVGAEKAQVNH